MRTFGVVVRPKAPDGYRGAWVNVYMSHTHNASFHIGGAYRNRRTADNVGKPYRYECVYIHVPVKETTNELRRV